MQNYLLKEYFSYSYNQVFFILGFQVGALVLDGRGCLVLRIVVYSLLDWALRLLIDRLLGFFKTFRTVLVRALLRIIFLPLVFKKHPFAGFTIGAFEEETLGDLVLW